MEDKHRLDDVKENNNDSKQDGINEENENQDTEKLDKKGEECGEPNDKLEKAKTQVQQAEMEFHLSLPFCSEPVLNHHNF
jgi:hypothetical protein